MSSEQQQLDPGAQVVRLALAFQAQEGEENLQSHLSKNWLQEDRNRIVRQSAAQVFSQQIEWFVQTVLQK